MSETKLSEKEREAKLKALRRELEEQIEADLTANLPAESDLERAGLKPAQAEGIVREQATPKRILEALLFASAKPLTVNDIRKIVQGIGMKEIQALVAELREEYVRDGRSYELIEIAGGWEMVTRKDFAPWLARLELQRKIRQASRSALETLAILAYKQPVTRAEIEDLRGVDVAAVLSTLLERGFIKIVGKKEVPGRPFLYGTTEKFLEHFGLKSIEGLPNIGEIKSLVERAVKKEELIGANNSEGEPRHCEPAEGGRSNLSSEIASPGQPPGTGRPSGRPPLDQPASPLLPASQAVKDSSQ